ncbi:MAG: rod-binding protein [Marinibacterium sp.]
MILPSLTNPGTEKSHSPVDRKPDPLRTAAAELETVFLAEMLKSAGLHESRSEFGGGAGEDQFQSLLVRAQAEEIVRSGGIGLAESLFQALKGRTEDG